METSSLSIYRDLQVASSRLSWLVAHIRIFRRFIKGKFDAYVLWPLAKKFQNWLVDQSIAREFTVCATNQDSLLLTTLWYMHLVETRLKND